MKNIHRISHMGDAKSRDLRHREVKQSKVAQRRDYAGFGSRGGNVNKLIHTIDLTGEPGQYAAFKNVLPSGNPPADALSVVQYRFKVTPGAEVEARIFGEFTTEKTDSGKPALYMVLGLHIGNFPGVWIGACFGSTGLPRNGR